MKANFSDDWDTDDSGLHNEINVTPFIDVVLVLLIVFMVAAPLATTIIPVQLPAITKAPAVVQPDEPVYVTLQKDSSLYVGDHLVSQERFAESLLKETNQNLETKILIKADSEIDYGTVVDLLNQVRIAGYTKVGLMGLQTSSHVASKKHEAGNATEEVTDDAMHTTNGSLEVGGVNSTHAVNVADHE
ncbi:biopolymer transporter ExbD [Bartonella sp. CB175]|uniref:biopolymer transporter ExbD n=1 Tax=Bartonella sp. CB175 TaxID=3112256 RepID=UPI00300E5562